MTIAVDMGRKATKQTKIHRDFHALVELFLIGLHVFKERLSSFKTMFSLSNSMTNVILQRQFTSASAPFLMFSKL